VNLLKYPNHSAMKVATVWDDQTSENSKYQFYSDLRLTHVRASNILTEGVVDEHRDSWRRKFFIEDQPIAVPV